MRRYEGLVLRCPLCRCVGWVCEKHPDQPWNSSCCEGAAVPCVCNPKSEPMSGRAFIESWGSVEGG